MQIARAGVVLGLVLTLSSMAVAADIAEYQALLEQADTAHRALDGASEAELPALLDVAADRDRAVIDWLDAFLDSQDFHGLPADQQAVAVRGRFRAEYNLAGVLVRQDKCAEAYSRVRALLDSAVNDAELRPRVVERYDEANACMSRVRRATLVVFAQPNNADVLVDGVFVGTADVPHPIDLGEHRVTVRAQGFYPQEQTALASTEDENIQIGPLVLEAMPEPEGGAPRWYEWTLWGAGAAGIAVGIGAFISARNEQDTLDNPGPGLEVADPQQAQDAVDRRDRVAYIAGSLGIVAAIAGTWSYLARQGDDGERDETGLDIRFGLAAVALDFRF